jgi:hypothetical protein
MAARRVEVARSAVRMGERLGLLPELDGHLPPGTVLRFPGGYPYEAMVDFMVCNLAGQGHALVVATGYKAGLVALTLPEDASDRPGGPPLASWLARNWQVWVWPDCAPSEVEVFYGYAPPPPPK